MAGLAAALLVTLGVAASGPAVAGAGTGRVPSAGPPTTSGLPLALVIGNNRSLSAERPDLRYADDDAMKYARLLRAHRPDAHLEVLTRLDEESARLFGADPVAGEPSRAAVRAAVARLALRRHDLEARGVATELFVVFAGHGDQREGQGWLELEDDRLLRQDLADAVATVGAPRAHVILDACNSFFVVHPRRPGGRAWVSSSEVGRGLEVPGIDVGVFLSTSAEAQVFEWSQLQSGIFSHLVRSGLAGGADVDHDGAVSYSELQAYVEVSSSGIHNTQFRPFLYVRPPAASDALLTADPGSRRLTLDDLGGHVTLRDEDGVRLLDVHPEAGFQPAVVVPGGTSLTVAVERPGDDGRLQMFEAELGPERVSVARADTAPGGGARASSALFGQLFATAFGPAAYAHHQEAHTDEPPRVFGVTRAQADRLKAQMTVLAEESRNARTLGMVTLASFAVGMGAGGALLAGLGGLYAQLETPGQRPGLLLPNVGSEVLLLMGGVLAGGGLAAALLTLGFYVFESDTEELLASMEAREAAGEDRASIVGDVLAGLEEQREAAGAGRVTAALILLSIGLVGAPGMGLLSLGLLFSAGWSSTSGLVLSPSPAPEDLVLASVVAMGVGLSFALIAAGVGTLLWPQREREELLLDMIEGDPEPLSERFPAAGPLDAAAE